MVERLERLEGATYKIKVPTKSEVIKIFITINEQNGKPFELFVRSSSAQFSEHMEVISVLVSHMLRDGQELKVVAKYFNEIHSAFTGHIKSGGYCSSVYARIGEVLLAHESNYLNEG